jgi:hypothetical protein
MTKPYEAAAEDALETIREGKSVDIGSHVFFRGDDPAGKEQIYFRRLDGTGTYTAEEFFRYFGSRRFNVPK